MQTGTLQQAALDNAYVAVMSQLQSMTRQQREGDDLAGHDGLMIWSWAVTYEHAGCFVFGKRLRNWVTEKFFCRGKKAQG